MTLEVAGRLGRSVDLFQNLNCLVMGTPTRLFEGQFVPYLGIPLCIIIDQKLKYSLGYTIKTYHKFKNLVDDVGSVNMELLLKCCGSRKPSDHYH